MYNPETGEVTKEGEHIEPYQRWKTKYRLRFRFRSFPLLILYIVISFLLVVTIIGIFFWIPLWANYLVNNVEIEETTGIR